MRRFLVVLALGCGVLFGGRAAVGQVVAGQVDDFQGGGTQGWGEGAGSPNPPEVIGDGGPDGMGDAFLQNASSGINGPGGRMIVFNNDARWRGDYLEAGIASLAVDLNNLGSQPLTMRFDLVRSSPSFPGNHVFTEGFEILPGSGWQHATFSLATQDLFSSGDMTGILGDVTELRLIHEPATPPMHPGQAVSALLGIDNIQALGPPGMGGLPGDYSDNGLVEQADLDLVLLNWGNGFDMLPAEWVNERPTMGIVDQAELDGVLLNWGNTADGAGALSAAAGVPEPTAAGLGAVGLVVLGAAGWCRRAYLREG